MTHASLFSGIGGFDLAAEWMGWENVFNCEIESFPRRILNYYFPKAISYEDITKTDFTVHRGRIDVLTGGWPCQPFSTAGKRLGKADSRHLFPEMLRAIKEIQPRWVIGENVRGFVSWNGGLVFDEVCADLEGEGYEVIPFLIPACAVNAPHRRDRVWFVAKNIRINGCVFGESIKEGAEVWQQRDIGAGDTERVRREEMAGVTAHANGGTTGTPREGRSVKSNWSGDNVQQSERKEQTEQHNRPSSFSWDAADTDSTNCKARTFGKILGQPNRQKTERFRNVECRNKWQNFPSVSPICDGNDGISDRLDSITFSKWRKESIKGGGNAIVPQISYAIFKAIVEYEKK